MFSVSISEGLFGWLYDGEVVDEPVADLHHDCFYLPGQNYTSIIMYNDSALTVKISETFTWVATV